jgi:HlyD family secretion protein
MNLIAKRAEFGNVFPLASSPVAVRPLHDPRREILIGGVLAALLFVGIGGWTYATRLDAAVIGPGVVRTSGGRQLIQTPAGGIVSAVRITNGSVVRKGQILIQFTTAQADAEERALAIRMFGLQAEIARITAELTGQSRVAAPATFAQLDGADRTVAEQALMLEQAQLDAQHALEATERSVLRDRMAQIGHQIAGNRQRLISTQGQDALTREELNTYEQLLKSGLTTKPRVLALRRSVAAASGEAGATSAEMARLREQGGEAQLQFVQARNERAAQNAERMRAAQTELQTVLPQWQAARDQLKRTVILAPFDGTVTALRTQAEGAIVAPGAQLLELVPTHGNLVVEARISLAEASELRAGQSAEVRLSALRGRLLKPLHGIIESISADSVEDDKTGLSYYTATVRISREEVARAIKMGEVDGGIRAGTPVEVVVATKPRSVLDFLISPLASRMAGTFAQR